MPEVKDLGLANNEIVSVVRTTGSGIPGQTDTYTITLRSGNTYTFNVTNGTVGGGVALYKTNLTSLDTVRTWLEDHNMKVENVVKILATFVDGYSDTIVADVVLTGGNESDDEASLSGQVYDMNNLSFVSADTYLTGKTSAAYWVMYWVDSGDENSYVPVSRTIAGINLESNIPIEELFSRMSVKHVISTVARLQELNPDHGYVYLVEENHAWYFWSNVYNQWVYGGEYKDNFLFENVALKFYDQIVQGESDLNDYKNSCFARILGPANAPTNENALLCVYRLRDMVIQVVTVSVTPTTWVRRYYIPTDTWTPWAGLVLPNNSVTRDMIQNNAVVKAIMSYGVDDFDTILNNETHLATGGNNNPAGNIGGVLRTYSSETNKYQLYYSEDGRAFGRKYTYATSSWSNWREYDAKAADEFFNSLDFSASLKGRTEQGGFLAPNGGYAYPDNYHSISYTKISCKPGDKFIYRGIGRSGAVSCIFYALDGISIIGTEQHNTPNEFVEITIPANCCYVTFSSFENINTTVVLEVYKTNSLTKRLETYCSSVLWQKRWASCGDSFTEGQFQGLDNPSDYTFTGDEKYKGKMKVYPYFIGNRTNCIVNNMGKSGMSLANFGSGASVANCFSYTNGLYTQIPENTDYITLYFGINDSHENVPIGTIDDNTNETFYGAWNVVISWILENRPNAKLGIIISNGCDTTAYPEATINICKKWGIPYLDINGDDKLPMVIRANMRNLSSSVYNYWYDKYKVTASNGHPNPKAHEDESYMIQQFLERL